MLSTSSSSSSSFFCSSYSLHAPSCSITMTMKFTYILLLFLFFSSMMCMRWNLAESSCFVQNTWRNTIYWLDYGRNVSLGWHNMAPPRTVQRYSLCSYVHKGRREEDGATQLGIWNKKVRKVAIIPIVMICSNRFLCSGGGLSSPQKDRTYNKYGEN